MKADIFTLCDAATISLDGKLNILGSYDTIWAAEAPVTMPLCCLAAKLRFMPDEEGAKSTRLSFIDSDGKSIIQPIEGTITVQVPAPESSASLPLTWMAQQLTLPDFGEYAVVLTVDGQESNAPLYVKQLPSQQS